MKRFFIITNEHRDENLSVTHSIQNYIAQKGGESRFYLSSQTEWGRRSRHKLEASDVSSDCILVLGGDGTLVRAARETAGLGIPLIGVNLGNVGYLCELDPANIYSAIDLLFEDRYEVESRMMIEGIQQEPVAGFGFYGTDGSSPDDEFVRSEEPNLALNDIVIHREGSAQIINLVLTVNGEYLSTYSADGMILSTPTGSTGYSMSAGGPIVDPKTEMLLITPVNPNTFSTRSIVVGADAEIEVTLASRRAEMDEEADVTFDGDHFIRMHIGDRIRVKRADVSAKILRLDSMSFLQILRKKMT